MTRWLLLSALLYLVPVLGAEPLAPGDFAYVLPLDADGRDALYRFTLPMAVYQRATRADLGDVRVFNAAGEVVPHALDQSRQQAVPPAPTRSLPMFPVAGTPEAGASGTEVRVERNAAGSIIEIHTPERAPTGVAIESYLLDAHDVGQPLQALILDWSDAEDFHGQVQLQASPDLAQWNELVANAPITRLRFGGHRLERNRIEFAPAKAPYLRLTWRPGSKPPALTTVTAELSASAQTARVFVDAKGSAVAGAPGEYAFDLGGGPPVDRLRVALPNANTVAAVEVLSRRGTKDEWRPVARSTLYRLQQNGQDLGNADLNLPPTRQRYWLLRVNQEGGGIGAGVPGLTAGWAHLGALGRPGSRGRRLGCDGLSVVAPVTHAGAAKQLRSGTRRGLSKIARQQSSPCFRRTLGFKAGVAASAERPSERGVALLAHRVELGGSAGSEILCSTGFARDAFERPVICDTGLRARGRRRLVIAGNRGH
jgi:hypothetical protein